MIFCCSGNSLIFTSDLNWIIKIVHQNIEKIINLLRSALFYDEKVTPI